MRFALAPGQGSSTFCPCWRSVCTAAGRGWSSLPSAWLHPALSCMSFACFGSLLPLGSCLFHPPCLVMSPFAASCPPSRARSIPCSQTHFPMVVRFHPQTDRSLPQLNPLLCPFSPILACTQQTAPVLAAASSATQMYRVFLELALQSQSRYPWPWVVFQSETHCNIMRPELMFTGGGKWHPCMVWCCVNIFWGAKGLFGTGDSTLHFQVSN